VYRVSTFRSRRHWILRPHAAHPRSACSWLHYPRTVMRSVILGGFDASKIPYSLQRNTVRSRSPPRWCPRNLCGGPCRIFASLRPWNLPMQSRQQLFEFSVCPSKPLLLNHSGIFRNFLNHKIVDRTVKHACRFPCRVEPTLPPETVATEQPTARQMRSPSLPKQEH